MKTTGITEERELPFEDLKYDYIYSLVDIVDSESEGSEECRKALERMGVKTETKRQQGKCPWFFD